MTLDMIFVILAVPILGTLSSWGIAARRRLLVARNRSRLAFARCEAAFIQRRHLTERLTSALASGLDRDADLLPAVRDALKQAAHVAHPDLARLDHPCRVRHMVSAENQLTETIDRLYSHIHQDSTYGDTLEHGGFSEISAELTTLEAHLQTACEIYNKTVAAFHVQRDAFPDNLLATACAIPPVPSLDWAAPLPREVRQLTHA